MGCVKYFLEWNWESAAVIERAIEINPNDAEAHTMFSFYLASVGRLDESFTSSCARANSTRCRHRYGHVGTRLLFTRRYMKRLVI